MARRFTYISDFTNKVIDDDSHLIQVRVLSHPLLDSPVKLDAFSLDVQSLLDKNQDLVTLEIVDKDETIKLLATVKEFDKLFTNNVDDVLGSAERYSEETAQPARRGRPSGSTNRAASTAAKPTASGMSKEQLAAVRAWANENGHTVSPRGRIAAPILQAFEEAHAS